MKSKLGRDKRISSKSTLRPRDAADLSQMLGEGLLARMAHLLSKRGLKPQTMHSVIDAATGAHGERARQARKFARQVFFDYPELLKEWFTNPKFTNTSGMPAVLQIRKGTTSFEALVRRATPGVDPGEALRVLIKTRAVSKVGRERIRARSRVFNTSNSDSLNAIRMFCVVDALLNMVERNVNVRASDRFNSGFYERVATNRAVPVKHISKFRDFLREQGDDFMQTVDDWLTTHSVHKGARVRTQKLCSVGTGLYMFASD